VIDNMELIHECKAAKEGRPKSKAERMKHIAVSQEDDEYTAVMDEDSFVDDESAVLEAIEAYDDLYARKLASAKAEAIEVQQSL